MRISEYIAALEAIKAEHGDLEVQKHNFAGHRVQVTGPKIAFTLGPEGQESYPRFWSTWNGDAAKGEMVVRV